jgi:hypothetical protein
MRGLSADFAAFRLPANRTRRDLRLKKSEDRTSFEMGSPMGWLPQTHQYHDSTCGNMTGQTISSCEYKYDLSRNRRRENPENQSDCGSLSPSSLPIKGS